MFKRVIPIPQTQKFQYVDTFFVARVKAISRQDCYNKIIELQKCPSCRNDIIIQKNNNSNIINISENSNIKNNENNNNNFNDNIEKKIK